MIFRRLSPGLLVLVGTWAGGFLCPAAVPADERPLRAIVDAELAAVWKAEGIVPAAAADDAEFLRRVYLDLVGTIPTVDEATAFLGDASPDKRTRLVDRLLADPRFADHEAAWWDLLFFGRNPSDNELMARREGFQAWLKERFEQNVPYDVWARDLLLSSGPTWTGPNMFFAQFRARPEDAAEAVSKLFLGTQIHCARCHDHPFDKWKQTDFYGVAGFFVRIQYVEANEGGKRHYVLAEKSTGDVLFTGPAKDQKPGQKGEPVAPRFLGGDVLVEPPVPEGFKEPDLKGVKDPPKPLFSRKQQFAEWATKPDNPYFAKALANRLWARYLGRGFYEPVDDLRPDVPPSLPGVFRALEEQIVAHKFDLKWLIRELVSTRAYQLSSAGPGTDASPARHERARVRPLTAEELMAVFRQATGFDEAVRTAGGKPETTSTPDKPYFMNSFGEPTNGRGEFQPSLSEHLFLNNSGNLRQSMIQPKKGNLADAMLTSQSPWPERVDRLFLSVLTRRPTESERTKFVQYLTQDEKAPGPAVEEAIWVLLNTSEFRFNH